MKNSFSKKINKNFFTVPAMLVYGVPGEDVELPCDVTPSKNDQVSMVLWFKDTIGIPVYR